LNKTSETGRDSFSIINPGIYFLRLDSLYFLFEKNISGLSFESLAITKLQASTGSSVEHPLVVSQEHLVLKVAVQIEDHASNAREHKQGRKKLEGFGVVAGRS
jgi:hypothetical protein